MTEVETTENVVRIVRTIGQELLETEHEAADRHAVDDREHIPRMKRIGDTVAATAAEHIESEDVASELAAELLDYAKEIYLESCMSNMLEGEDPEEWRQESEEIFEEILAGRDPWRT